MFWVISVYFNARNILPKSGTFPSGYSVYIYIIYIYTHIYIYNCTIIQVSATRSPVQPTVTFHVPFPNKARYTSVTGRKVPSKGTTAVCCQTLNSHSINYLIVRRVSYGTVCGYLRLGRDAVSSGCQQSEASGPLGRHI